MTISPAESKRMPFGSPVTGWWRITPPVGFGVEASMPSRCNALLLTPAECEVSSRKAAGSFGTPHPGCSSATSGFDELMQVEYGVIVAENP